MKLIDILKEEKENNFYLFKKNIKNFLAHHNLFLDKIEITKNATIIIEFHPSDSSKFPNNQYYSIFDNFLVTRGFNYGDILELFKEKSKFREFCFIAGDKICNFFQEKPVFKYESGSGQLDTIFNEFQEKVKTLITLSFPPYGTVLELESYMKNKFIDKQRQMLKSITYEVYESVETTFMLYNPEKKENYIDVTFDISMDKKTYFIVGNIIINYDRKEYKNHFSNLDEFKEIFNIILNFLDISLPKI